MWTFVFINILKDKTSRLSLKKCRHECRAEGQQVVSIPSHRQKKTLGFSGSLRLDQAVCIVPFSAICSFKAEEIHLHSFISLSVGSFSFSESFPSLFVSCLCPLCRFPPQSQITVSVLTRLHRPHIYSSAVPLPPVLSDLKCISTHSRSGFIWANLLIFFSSSIFPGNCLSIDNMAAWQDLLWARVNWADRVIKKEDQMITHSWLHHQGHLQGSRSSDVCAKKASSHKGFSCRSSWMFHLESLFLFSRRKNKNNSF